jgi:APA family basic amino acid/polyamine antiporter
MFTDALSLALLASCLFVLRRRGQGAQGIFKMPGYPILPAAYVAIVLAVAADVLVHQTGLALAGLGIVAAGTPLYFVLKRSWGPATS